MSTNPYSPPRAAVGDAAESPPRVARKPVSAWLLQISCTLSALPLASVLVGYIRDMLTAKARFWDELVGVFLFDALVMGLLLAAVWRTQRRAGLGRCLGVVFIALVLVLGLWIVWSTYVSEAVDRQPATGLFLLCLAALWLALIGGWMWAFALSRSARDWFAPRTLALVRARHGSRR